MKILKFGQEAQEKLLEGCKIMYDAVGTTYSPAGMNVAYARQWGAPKIVHDGVTVAKEVEVEDESVQLGVDLIKVAAENQVEGTGDGTSVTTILSYHIVEKGMKLIKSGEINGMKLRKQILKALPELTAEIKTLAKEVKTKEQIQHVAMVSADDSEIADAVSEAVEKVGTNGLVTVELNKKRTIECEYTQGMELDRGYGMHSVFVTNPDRMEAVLEDTSVLILGRKVTGANELLPLMAVVMSTGSKSVLIVGEVSGDALMLLATNKMKGNISTLVVPSPAYGEHRKNIMEDIAILTGSTVVTDEIGMSPEEFTRSFNKDWIGTTKKVIATRGTTNILKYEPEDFKGEPAKKTITQRNEAIKSRIALIQKQRDETESTYEREQYSERLARLTTGIAVVKIGSSSELETNEKIERAKDAVPAVQAAIAEGIVPGGAVAFLQMAKVLEGRTRNPGEQLLYDVLHEPMKKILENSGEEPRAIEAILDEVKRKGGSYGYNVLSEKVEDLAKAGVIDPAKVIRLALENSVSTGTSILTTACAIANKRQPVNTNMQMA